MFVDDSCVLDVFGWIVLLPDSGCVGFVFLFRLLRCGLRMQFGGVVGCDSWLRLLCCGGCCLMLVVWVGGFCLLVYLL